MNNNKDKSRKELRVKLTDSIGLSDRKKGVIKRGEISWAYFPIAYNILLILGFGMI